MEHAAQKVQASVCMHIPRTAKLEYAMKSLVTKGQLSLDFAVILSSCSDALLIYANCILFTIQVHLL